MWTNVAIVLILLGGIYGFLCLVGWRTRRLSRHTDRTADSMYDNYADSAHRQERFADEHGGSWRDDDPARRTDDP